MFRVFQEERLITICMFAFLGSSILLRVFLGLLYRNMIKEADNMASTRNRLLKQCKTKFASCYQLGNGVANIPVFVDKFLNRMTLGHLSFETIYHMSGQLMLLSVVFSGIGVCKSIIGGRTVGEVLPFYIVSFFGLYVYFSVSTVVDVRGKKRVLKINLVDYLENHLSPRIDVTRQDMEMLYGEAVFEEKRIPYGRAADGRGGRRKGRKAGRGVRQEKRRTVELMPIESRMAVGGELLQEEFPMGQAYAPVQEMPQGRQGMQMEPAEGYGRRADAAQGRGMQAADMSRRMSEGQSSESVRGRGDMMRQRSEVQDSESMRGRGDMMRQNPEAQGSESLRGQEDTMRRMSEGQSSESMRGRGDRIRQGSETQGTGWTGTTRQRQTAQETGSMCGWAEEQGTKSMQGWDEMQAPKAGSHAEEAQDPEAMQEWTKRTEKAKKNANGVQTGAVEPGTVGEKMDRPEAETVRAGSEESEAQATRRRGEGPEVKALRGSTDRPDSKTSQGNSDRPGPDSAGNFQAAGSDAAEYIEQTDSAADRELYRETEPQYRTQMAGADAFSQAQQGAPMLFGRQAQSPPPMYQGNGMAQEDPAAVTEEELEALLREFLTT